jgi:hypothetical protein
MRVNGRGLAFINGRGLALVNGRAVHRRGSTAAG